MTPTSAPEPLSPPEISDEVLMQRLRNGDIEAGEILVNRYYQPLLRYLQRLVGDGMAEELLQQSWLSVFDHADKFVPESGVGGFRAWMFRIATNKANDYWRSRGREKAAHEGLRRIADERMPPADGRLQSTEQELKLQRAIAQLPESQRQVLLLRYYSDLKFVEIARILGCPLNTALGRVHKAMIKLRMLMGEP